MTNVLIKRFSIRSVGVAGAFLYSVPNCLAALVTYTYELAANFVIQGVGLGLMFTICNTNFNAFFVKKRSKVRMNFTILGMMEGGGEEEGRRHITLKIIMIFFYLFS